LSGKVTLSMELWSKDNLQLGRMKSSQFCQM
jgi:hypothetical protein